MNSKYSLLILFNLIDYFNCQTYCMYYPNYPEAVSFQTTNCQYGCCGPMYPIRASESCCSAPSNSWIAYPVIFISLVVVGSILYALCCTKFKPLMNSRFKKVTPTLERPESEHSSDVYIIEPNFNGRITSAPPPRYEEVFNNNNNNNNSPVININRQAEVDREPLPVLPGSYVPYK